MEIPEHHKFRKAWRWSPEIERKLSSWMETFHSLHICAGNSNLGTVRLDVDPDSHANVIGSMRNLPFLDESFDVTLYDPPWKLNIFQRFRPHYEAIRVTKKGGTIIINAPWMPYSNECVLEEVYYRCDAPFRMASLMMFFRKI